MAKSDNDMLDAALDAAEEKLAADPKDEPKEEAVEKEEAPEVEETPSEDAPKEQISDQEPSEEVSEEPTEVVEQSSLPAPAHWTAKTKALFSKAPPELQQALVEEAKLQQQHMGRLGNETNRAKQWETRVNSNFGSPEDLNKHRAIMRANGVTDEVEELHRYRAWNEVLSQDPLTAVRTWIVQHGITPEELNGESFGDENQGSSVNQDPRIDELSSKFEQLEKEKQESVRRSEEEKFAGVVNTWKSGNDRYGKPRSEFSKLYAPQIDQRWQEVLRQAAEVGEELTIDESLNRAFNDVQDSIYKAHGINPIVQKQQSKEELIAKSKKLNAIASKASGAPRTDVIAQKPKKTYKNDKEWVEAAMQRAEGRAGARR